MIFYIKVVNRDVAVGLQRKQLLGSGNRGFESARHLGKHMRNEVSKLTGYVAEHAFSITATAKFPAPCETKKKGFWFINQ